ncbi:hypothetical protein [Nocardia niwae]|uniref:hypothetical protein n=1 Tax=Nocardia niwae TaxID=626084 RepID=UPI0033FA9F4B
MSTEMNRRDPEFEAREARTRQLEDKLRAINTHFRDQQDAILVEALRGMARNSGASPVKGGPIARIVAQKIARDHQRHYNARAEQLLQERGLELDPEILQWASGPSRHRRGRGTGRGHGRER